MKQWINDYYKQGLYSLDDMSIFVQAKWINESDYQEITGEVY